MVFFDKKNRETFVVLGACLVLASLVIGAHWAVYPHPSIFHDGLDQSYYLNAARAWSELDLTPARHHYLPLYPLLGAAFVWLTPAQPFMIPDLLCLLASLLAFVRIGRRLAPGWNDTVLTLCFLAAVLSGKWMFFWLWVMPWTSTGSAPLQFAALLLALRFGERPAPRRAAVLGLCIGTVAGFRPSDAGILALTCGAYAVFALVRDGATRRIWVMTAGAATAGLLAGALPWMAAHLAIFGVTGGPYVQKSAAIGFEWRLLPIRWVTLVIDARPLLPTGNGMAEVLPWVIPGIAGMLAALMPRAGRPVAPAALVASTVTLHAAVYLTYRDLNPDGLWRFVNVHYFKWIFPFLTLWAAQFAAALVAGRAERTRAFAAGALTLSLFAWRPLLRKPEAVAVTYVNGTSGRSLRLAQGFARLDRALFIDLSGTWENIHAGKFVLHDGQDFHSQYDFKVLPLASGALIFPLRPLPPGPAVLDLPPGIGLRAPDHMRMYAQAIVLGIPCGILPRRRACVSPLPAPR